MRSAMLIVWALLSGAAGVDAQQHRASTNLPRGEYVDTDFALEIQVSGALAEGERIAVLMGDVDVSGLLVPMLQSVNEVAFLDYYVFRKDPDTESRALRNGDVSE